MAKAEPVRAFWLAQKKALGEGKVPDAASVGCGESPEAQQAPLFDKAKAKLAAKDVGAAVACARAALKGLEELEAELGHVHFLLKDTAGALSAYDRALETNADNVDARYSRAAVLLDTQARRRGLAAAR